MDGCDESHNSATAFSFRYVAFSSRTVTQKESMTSANQYLNCDTFPVIPLYRKGPYQTKIPGAGCFSNRILISPFRVGTCFVSKKIWNARNWKLRMKMLGFEDETNNLAYTRYFLKERHLRFKYRKYLLIINYFWPTRYLVPRFQTTGECWWLKSVLLNELDMDFWFHTRMSRRIFGVLVNVR